MKKIVASILTLSMYYFGIKCLLYSNFYSLDADLSFLFLTTIGSLIIVIPAISFWYNEWTKILNNEYRIK